VTWRSWRAFQGLAAARSGRLDEAARILSEVRQDARANPVMAFGPELLGAELALARGELNEAERLFRDFAPELKAFFSLAEGPPTLLSNNNAFRDGLARVKVAQGIWRGRSASTAA
jgi:hypothetical protein